MQSTRLILILTILFSCSSVSHSQKQGINGKVVWVSGNQMPGPDRKPAEPKGIEREIHIYEATTLSEVSQNDGVFFNDIKTKLIKTVKSKADGTFHVNLPPGEYSVFVQEKDGLFANLFDEKNCISCVSVQKNEFLSLTIQVNYQAAY